VSSAGVIVSNPSDALSGLTGQLGFIPSPSQGVWDLGPFPIRAYALCIIAGIITAVWLGNRRFIARGGLPGTVADVAVWVVPLGIIGGRLYHVITDWQLYFGEQGAGFAASLKIWDGGLGIWGAVVLGGVGAWIGCRRRGIPLPPFADAIAPGIAIAQAMGRFGNYFNQELFGRPTTVPWALEIDPVHRPIGYEQYATFQPTFLYEAIGLLSLAAICIWADRRFQLGHGRVFALYVLLYAIVRGVVESLRIDEAHHFFGIRLNDFTAVVVGVGALIYLIVSARLRPGREEIVDPRAVEDAGGGEIPAEGGDRGHVAPGTMVPELSDEVKGDPAADPVPETLAGQDADAPVPPTAAL
jgi:prolipoprotein diacylglyceryl transferase